VPHQRLLEKLRKHGIAGKVLGVIENWLKGRRQRVCIRKLIERQETEGVYKISHLLMSSCNMLDTLQAI